MSWRLRLRAASPNSLRRTGLARALSAPWVIVSGRPLWGSTPASPSSGVRSSTLVTQYTYQPSSAISGLARLRRGPQPALDARQLLAQRLVLLLQLEAAAA